MSLLILTVALLPRMRGCSKRPTLPRLSTASMILAALLTAPLAVAAPAFALGLPLTPPILPDPPQTACAFGSLPLGDAGDDFDSASYLPNGYCSGTLVEHVDEEDWYRLGLSEGDDVTASLWGSFADLTLCLYRPSDPTNAVKCSDNPGASPESVWGLADEYGDWRLQVRTKGGSATYQIQTHVFTPCCYARPDFGVDGVSYAKPTLRTDLADTGIGSPVGLWRLSARVTNYDAFSWDCRQVRFYVQATVQPTAYISSLGSLFSSSSVGPVASDWVCINRGEAKEVSVDWHPWGALGDVRICVRLDDGFDGNSGNDEACVDTFSVIGGV